MQPGKDSPEDMIPPPSEFGNPEITEPSDTATYTLHTDNDDVFYYVMCGK